MQNLPVVKLMLVCLTLSSLALNSIALENEISCEKVEADIELPKDSRKRCVLTQTTKINAGGFLINSPRDESVERIDFAYNKQIEYLPENISEAFPNLKVYDAAACAIRKISRANFVNLKSIQKLFFDGNLIERVEGDVFEGLTTLEFIYLSHNNIKFIDVNAFATLNNLKRLDLFNNNCISTDFRSSDALKTVTAVVTNQCQAYANVCNDETAKLRQQLDTKQRRIDELEKQLPH